MRFVFSAVVALALASPHAMAAGSNDYEQPAPPADVTADAQAALAVNDYAAALTHLAAAETKDPNNPDVHNLKGFSLRKLGRFDEAGAAYGRALAIDPDHEGALEYQGELFLKLGQPDKARSNAERLDALCFFDCSVRDKLLASIEAYTASN